MDRIWKVKRYGLEQVCQHYLQLLRRHLQRVLLITCMIAWPIGQLGPMVLMMLNVVFGGEGVGLMNLLIFVLLTVFICSLMVGKTPEYLNMPIGAREMKCIVLVFLIHPILILVFSALAFMIPGASESMTNPSFHGISQVMYEMTSAAANNGSGFEGLKDDTTFWNISQESLCCFLVIYQLFCN